VIQAGSRNALKPMARRKYARGAGVVLGFLIVCATLAWATRTAFSGPAAPETNAIDYVHVSVTTETVGRTLPVQVAVKRKQTRIATNLLTGVVTSVRPGRRDQGDVAYSVGSVRVRVVEGRLPFYRDLTYGDKGRDVKQIQQALRDLGYHLDVDGQFGQSTARAYGQWQARTTGDRFSGTIPLGHLVAVPSLPARISLSSVISKGALLSGGEPSLSVQESLPTFSLQLSREQARGVPADAEVRVFFKRAVWRGLAAAVETGPSEGASETVELSVTSRKERPICASECGGLPFSSETSLRGEVVLVPEESGPAVPVAALTTDAVNRAYVTMDDGSERQVEVVAIGQGLAIVRGLQIGERVRVSSRGGGA
jgi:hypothetical protein